MRHYLWCSCGAHAHVHITSTIIILLYNEFGVRPMFVWLVGELVGQSKQTREVREDQEVHP